MRDISPVHRHRIIERAVDVAYLAHRPEIGSLQGSIQYLIDVAENAGLQFKVRDYRITP